MTTKPFASLALSTLLLAAACGAPPAAPPAVDTAAEEAALSAGTDAWFAAYNAGDVEKIVSMYADDAVVMPPHAPATASREALRTFVTADVAGAKAAGIVLVNGASSASVSGNLGWHQGVYTVKDASGGTVDSGSYMEVWKKGADGKWLIVRDIWNSDRPAVPPSPAPAAS